MKKWESSLKRAGQFYPAPTTRTVNDKHPTADAKFKISCIRVQEFGLSDSSIHHSY